MSREDGANQIRSMNREQEDGWWETQRGGAEGKTVNTKANNGTHGKTGRHNLSQEKEAVAEQKRLKQRLIVDDLSSAGLGTICSDCVTRILNTMLDNSIHLSFHVQP